MKKIGFLLGFLSILLTSCSKNVTNIVSEFFCFDTYVSIKIYEGCDVTKIEDIFARYNKLSDNYHSSDITNVYSINQTNEQITVTEDLYDLLETSFTMSEKAGYFNPLCGSLSKKWKDALADKTILSDDVIASELIKMNSSKLFFLDNNVIQREGEAEIDLGGIAKGYSLDTVKKYFDDNNIHQYLINAGSSSVLLGEKNTKDGLFNVGLKDVKNAYFKAKNCFVSTSSISEQSEVIDGVTYSHIVNPVNGRAISKNDAVVVFSDNGALGDALSTSMMNNTVEEIKNIENELGVKTIIINNGQITYSNSSIEVLYH